MIVKRAAVLGRCMGVRRAVELALKTAEAEEKTGRQVFTLGPLIHNPQAVADLEARGIRALMKNDEAGDLRNAVVIIRAHGVPPELKAQFEARGAKIVDATCPRVIASQRKAEDYAKRGYQVVIAGDRDHGEVTGLSGYAQKGAASAPHPNRVAVSIVASATEAAALELSPPLALIAQTTITDAEYQSIRKALAARLAEQERRAEGKGLEASAEAQASPALVVVDSICPATEERLEALERLAAEVDAIVVVGGRNSANTARLFSTAVAFGKPAWLIETAAELPPEAFGYERVGVTAGASSPDEVVDEVEAALRSGRA
jgi:4-hydroxy-3-methylbut-2-en-1-yl diphosphate reductase